MATQRSRCFLDITIGPEPAGRLVIEMFNDKTPKTCENFRVLCTGEKADLTYRLSPFHRVIDEFMVQGGDITKGDGTGGDSIYGGEFEDENLDWREIDAPGLVCMANRGKGTNSSQFFITLDSCTHLNGKHTIFGSLVSGQEVLDRIAKVDVDKNDKPREPVLIARCGELERKKKAPAKTAVGEASAYDRGRDDRLEPRGERRKRRESDNAIDETFRGRPLTRSKSRSQSRPRSSAVEEEDESRSPMRKHKRRRSPSPSRAREEEEKDREDDGNHRRRRSLPNQYAPDKAQRRERSRDRERYQDDNRGRRYDREDRRIRDGPRDWDRPDHRGNHPDRRYNRDRYDARRDRYREDNSGRLDGGGSGEGGSSNESGIKFKGRGSMKFREPDRRW